MKSAEIRLEDLRPGRARGSEVGTSKLTEAKVIQIRRLREQGAGVLKLAAAFGVSPATVRSVVGRRTWGHIPQEEAPAADANPEPAPRKTGKRTAAGSA